MNWWVIASTFIAVNLDFFFILILLLKRFRLRDVMIGYLLGVILLVTASYAIGRVLAIFLPEWLLGVLGVLPIWMAIHDNDEAPKTGNHHLPILTVLVTYLSVCAGCNLSIFLPVLTGLSWHQFTIALLFISFCTILVVWLLKLIGDLPPVNWFMTTYSEILMKVVYIGVGLYVFWDSGLISHLIQFI